MKILLKMILIISLLKAFIVFLLLIMAIIGWISGVDNVLFPGLGLVVTMPVIIIFLLIIGILLIAFSAFIRKLISKTPLQ